MRDDDFTDAFAHLAGEHENSPVSQADLDQPRVRARRRQRTQTATIALVLVAVTSLLGTQLLSTGDRGFVGPASHPSPVSSPTDPVEGPWPPKDGWPNEGEYFFDRNDGWVVYYSPTSNSPSSSPSERARLRTSTARQMGRGTRRPGRE